MTNYEKLKTLTKEEMLAFYYNWNTSAIYCRDENGAKYLANAQDLNDIDRWLNSEAEESSYLYDTDGVQQMILLPF